MVITKTINLYTFDELSEKAKTVARIWYLEASACDDWWGSTYEDVKYVAALMGIEIKHILFSGFWSQGDGACFESSFAYRKGCVKAVKKYAPKDETLHSIARDWQALQKANGYKLQGTTCHQGHYQHSNCTRVMAHNSGTYEFDTDDSYVRDNKEPGAEAARILRRLMEWIYSQLEKEYEHQTSDETVDDNIRANEYTFRENGKRED